MSSIDINMAEWSATDTTPIPDSDSADGLTSGGRDESAVEAHQLKHSRARKKKRRVAHKLCQLAGTADRQSQPASTQEHTSPPPKKQRFDHPTLCESPDSHWSASCLTTA